MKPDIDRRASPNDLTASEAIANVLRSVGVQYAFAYPGTSELALCDALDRTESISLVNARGDKEAAFMAAGASLLSPSRGIAVLHGARGLTNAAGALADIRRNEIGTFFLIGMPSTRSAQFLPPHAEVGLIDAMAQFAGWAWETPPVPEGPGMRETAADDMIHALKEGLRVAATGPRKPVLFAIPQDVSENRWVPRASVDKMRGCSPIEISPSIGDAVSALRSASRPVFFIDDYALKSDGLRDSLDEISALVGAPVLQLRYSRGPMLFERLTPAAVRNFVGWFDPLGGFHRELLEACDLLVTVEDRNMYHRVVGPLPKCTKLAITSDSAKTTKNDYLAPGDSLVLGDPAVTLRLIAAQLKPRSRLSMWSSPDRMTTSASVAGMHTRLDARHASVCSAIASVMRGPHQSVLIDDSQMFGGLISNHYDLLPDALRVFGDHGGFVGAGIAQATGLALSEPGVRVVCTLGDEGFANGMQGLQAAVQEAAHVMFIVCSNGGAVSLQKQAAEDLGPGDRSYLSSASLVPSHAIANGMGIPSSTVVIPLLSSDEEFDHAIVEFTTALHAAAEESGPSLIEVVLPSDPAAWKGIWQLQGLDVSEGRNL